MLKPNGSGARRFASWIDAFVEHTANLETPVAFRRWAGIAAIGAVLEQKVWLCIPTPVFPNIYTVLVGHPGVGKTRTIRAVRNLLVEIPEFYIAPTSLTSASLVDALGTAKRTFVCPPNGPALEYNSMTIVADELGTFMHEYSTQMVSLLSAFYDPDPYGEQRRGRDFKVKIPHPQISMLCGTTPSNLLRFIPEYAWDQGFTSRIVLIYSDKAEMGDIFATKSTTSIENDLLRELMIINSLAGQFEFTPDYKNLISLWRKSGMKPTPTHPKLLHYNTRRLAHIFKLSMISAIDRADILVLARDDFNRAMNWLCEAELYMPDIFDAGAGTPDSKAMDEVFYFMKMHDKGAGVPESRLVRFVGSRVATYSVTRVLEIMQADGRIKIIGLSKQGTRIFGVGS